MDVKLLQIKEDEKLTQDPNFWEDPKRAESVMRQIRNRKVWTDAYQQCHSATEDTVVMYDFFKRRSMQQKLIQL